MWPWWATASTTPPALTRADTGIAIGAGTDVAIDAADVVLMKSRLSDVPAAIRLSRATLRNIHENLFWAFFYNSIGIPLAAGVFVALGLTLNPMFGAAAMSLSSVCVVSNALRLNFFDMHDGRRDKKVRHKPRKDQPQDAAPRNTACCIVQCPVEPAPAAEGTVEKTMEIEGMMCEHCERTVQKALEAVSGVQQATADAKAGTAVILMLPDTPEEALTKAVEEAGYLPHGMR